MNTKIASTTRDLTSDLTRALDLVTKSARIVKERIIAEPRPTELVGVWNDLQSAMDILSEIDARTARRDPTRRGER